MSVRTATAAALLTGAAAISLGTAAPALALCDAYSGGCPSTPPSQAPGDVGGGTDSPATGGGTENPSTESPSTENPSTENPSTGGGTDTPATGGGTDTPATGGGNGNPGLSGTTTSPATLPFTGGELVLMTAAGLGALAGGTALVVAGRRKAVTPA